MNYTPTPKPNSNTQKTLDFRVKYKTQKCRYWLEKGYCPYNQTCAFAHFDQEIRDKNYTQKYKTKMCINFNTKGCCKYGERCQYIHNEPKNKIEDGRKTRSNSQDSNSQTEELLMMNSSEYMTLLTHHRKVELIRTLGLDFMVRSSSRLMQLVRYSQHDQQENDLGCEAIQEFDGTKDLEMFWFDTV